MIHDSPISRVRWESAGIEPANVLVHHVKMTVEDHRVRTDRTSAGRTLPRYSSAMPFRCSSFEYRPRYAILQTGSFRRGSNRPPPWSVRSRSPEPSGSFWILKQTGRAAFNPYKSCRAPAHFSKLFFPMYAKGIHAGGNTRCGGISRYSGFYISSARHLLWLANLDLTTLQTELRQRAIPG